MELNEHIVKLQGKANIPKELLMGRSYSMSMTGAVDNISDSDNEDGTFDRLYRFRPLVAEIMSDNGETMKTKEMRSWGKQMRAAIWHEWKESNEPVSEEDFYSDRMRGLIRRIMAGEV